MRNIVETIDKMLAVIPAEEVGLRGELEHIQRGAGYTAPEVQHKDWQKAMYALGRAVPDPVVAWELEVRDIFTGADPDREAKHERP